MKNGNGKLDDIEQLHIWKAALEFADRGVWSRALTKAIAMIESRDAQLRQATKAAALATRNSPTRTSPAK